MGVSENSGSSPQIIHFNRVFHYKPSSLGYHFFWKHQGHFFHCSTLAPETTAGLEGSPRSHSSRLPDPRESSTNPPNVFKSVAIQGNWGRWWWWWWWSWLLLLLLLLLLWLLLLLLWLLLLLLPLGWYPLESTLYTYIHLIRWVFVGYIISPFVGLLGVVCPNSVPLICPTCYNQCFATRVITSFLCLCHKSTGWILTWISNT